MKRFTKTEEMQLIGLHTVYQNLCKQQKEIELAAVEITKESESDSRVGEWLYEDVPSLKQLNKYLDYEDERNANS